MREKPHCNVGTIGHVDHGKTTLTAAITKGTLQLFLVMYHPGIQFMQLADNVVLPSLSTHGSLWIEICCYFKIGIP